jgi:hypothetical protein
MGDKLKVFKDAVLTGADATGDLISLVTTGATDQAIVKDIQFGEVSHGDTSNIVIGDLLLASRLENMTGSEIMDNNEVLSIKLPENVDSLKYLDTLVYPDISVSTTSAKIGKTGKIITNSINSNNFTTSVESDGTGGDTPYAPLAVTTMSTPKWLLVKENYAYYFRYDGNSTTHLYRASIIDGVIGSWVAVDQSSYAYKVYEPVANKVYWSHSGVFYQHDCATNITTNKNVSGIVNPSTYTKAGVLGDYFFLMPSNGNSSFHILHIPTLKILSYTGISEIATSTGAIAAVKTKTHYLIYVSENSVTTMYSKTISDFEKGTGAFTSTVFSSTNSKYGDNSTFSGDSQGRLWYLDVNRKPCYAQVSESDTGLIANVIDDTAVTSGVGLLPGTFTEGNPVLPANLDINIKCRVSGIEVTEE